MSRWGFNNGWDMRATVVMEVSPDYLIPATLAVIPFWPRCAPREWVEQDWRGEISERILVLPIATVWLTLEQRERLCELDPASLLS